MGKVKEWKEKYPDRVTEYQFPMGKVKFNGSDNPSIAPYVSIPYGKGKEQHLVLCFYYNT